MHGNSTQRNSLTARVQDSIDYLGRGGYYLRGGLYVQFEAKPILLGNGGDLAELDREAKSQKRFGGMNVAVVDKEGRIHYGVLERVLDNESGNPTGRDITVSVSGPEDYKLREHEITALFRLYFTGNSFPPEWLDGRGN